MGAPHRHADADRHLVPALADLERLRGPGLAQPLGHPQRARYDRPLSVLMSDVDLFKEINDGYGHQAGDEVLRALAERCRGVLRAVDVLGRVGGEEFAATLTETDRPPSGVRNPLEVWTF